MVWFFQSPKKKMKVKARTLLCIRSSREKQVPWNSSDGSAIHRKADFWIMEAQIFYLFIFFCCNFTHLVAFLGHYCKTLPKVSNICYSYARGIRLNMSYGKKVLQSLTLLSAITRERKREREECCVGRNSLSSLLNVNVQWESPFGRNRNAPQSVADWRFGFNYRNVRGKSCLLQVRYNSSSLNGEKKEELW